MVSAGGTFATGLAFMFAALRLGAVGMFALVTMLDWHRAASAQSDLRCQRTSDAHHADVVAASEYTRACYGL